MAFTSTKFILFLAVTLTVLALFPGVTFKKRLLAIASCFFYAAWDWRYLGLLLTISVIDFVAASRIAGTTDRGIKRKWLILSLVSNLGILGYFKYCNFFIANFNALAGSVGIRISEMDVLLPVGISFYTFKTLSYTIDVYRGEIPPCRSWLDYATFITFFPELIAGPIVRASIFLPQLNRDIGPTRSRLAAGFSIFLVGFAKKLLVADRMAVIADTVFAKPQLFDSATLWCGVVAYTVQIYCDFSGYSDMAIGVARMIGYDLPENFNLPYLSTNITEFWRRWHMTLSMWLRDYLYIPLGGNRTGASRTYVNLMLTMLLGGLWHGASWNFVLWGGLHGVALAAHKLWSKSVGRRIAIPEPCGWLLTFVFVMFTWIPFRSRSFSDTVIILKGMLFINSGRYGWVSSWLLPLLIFCAVGHFVGLRIGRLANGWDGGLARRFLGFLGFVVDENEISGANLVVNQITIAGSYIVMLMLLFVLLFAPLDMNPFIYFQF